MYFLIGTAPQAKEIKVSEVEFNPDFISRMIQKVDWPALCKAAENVNYSSHHYPFKAVCNIPL